LQALARQLVHAVDVDATSGDTSLPTPEFPPLVGMVRESDDVIMQASALPYSPQLECGLLGNVFGAYHTTSGAISGEVRALVLTLELPSKLGPVAFATTRCL
jgi:hypothetical protein